MSTETANLRRCDTEDEVVAVRANDVGGFSAVGNAQQLCGKGGLALKASETIERCSDGTLAGVDKSYAATPDLRALFRDICLLLWRRSVELAHSSVAMEILTRGEPDVIMRGVSHIQLALMKFQQTRKRQVLCFSDRGDVTSLCFVS